MFFLKIVLTFSLLFLLSCNRNLTEEQKKEMWSKAQTTGAIIERSGTKFNSATNKEVALRDAETRLQTGGGLFKDGGISVSGLLNNDNNTNINNELTSQLENFEVDKSSEN